MSIIAMICDIELSLAWISVKPELQGGVGEVPVFGQIAPGVYS